MKIKTKRKQLLDFASSINLCTRCFSNDSIDGKRICPKCRETMNRWSNKRYHKTKDSVNLLADNI